MIDRKIISLLKPLKLKYYIKNLIHITTISLMIWGAISLVFMIVSRFVPLTYIWNKVFIILFISISIGFSWSIYKKPSYKETAILLDSFGLKERTLTSLELKGKDYLVARIQKEDTIKLLENEDLKSKISLKPSLRILLFILVFLISTTVVSFIPTKSYVLAKEKEKTLEKLEKEKAKIEKVKEKVKKDEVLKLEEKKEIEKNIDKIRKTLEKPKDFKNIQKEIVKAKRELEKINKDVNQRKMNKISKQLENKSFTKKLAEKLKKRNSHEIAKSIEDMANKIKKMNKEDLEKLVQELKELQEALKNNPKLAKAFKEVRDAIAQSIQQGSQNSSIINQSLQNLNKTINNMLNDSTVSSQVNEALKNLDELNDTISEMSGNKSSSDNKGNSKNQSLCPTGEHDGEGGGWEYSGQSPGSGNGNNGNGNNGSGSSGAGNGSSQGSENGGGSSQSSSGSRQGSSGKKPKDYEKVFTPKRLNIDGESTKIHDKMDKSGKKDTIEVKKFGEHMGEAIPFSEVFKSYKNSEYQRLEEKEIPANMREVVKEYFIKLDE